MRDMYSKAMRAMKGNGTPVAEKDKDRLKRQMKQLRTPKTAEQLKNEATTQARQRQKEALK